MSRRPSTVLVVDPNILVRFVLGRLRFSPLSLIAGNRTLLIPERGVEECDGVLRGRPDYPTNRALIDRLLPQLNVIAAARYSPLLAHAANVLRHASPSQDASTKDDHMLAVAWLYEADIWSHDRDFAGTGWPSWSSANLKAALEAEALDA